MTEWERPLLFYFIYLFLTLPYKEEEEAAKAESEEKKIIDPNGDDVTGTDTKHLIEYSIHFCFSLVCSGIAFIE